MTSLISGLGLGVFDSSLSQLGKGVGGDPRGAASRHGEYVNIATGNLVVREQDQHVSGHGFLAAHHRTYNSQGLLGEFGADGWLGGFESRAGLMLLNGLNARGSQVAHLLGDGSRVYYRYDEASGDYIGTAGDGAHDRFRYIARNGNRPAYWLWSDGNGARSEEYVAGTLLGLGLLDGRLTRTTDLRSGASYGLEYDSQGRLQRVLGDHGDALVFEYERYGSRLLGLSTLEAGVQRSQLRYGYDQQGRLVRVESDLTPGDWSDNDRDAALSFVTQYAYEDYGQRLSRVVHSDGTESSYTYHDRGLAYGRVRSVSSGRADDGSLQILYFDYDLDNRSTQVSDASGRSWTYVYDKAGQLLQTHAPAVDGLRDVADYAYDAAGNLIRSSVQRGAQVLSRSDYRYDANGNLLWQWDQVDPAQGGAARAIQRSYTAGNQLASETVYTGLDADGADPAQAPTGGRTTRWVYDQRNRLRYTIDAAGAVEERTYHASGGGAGQLAGQRRYLGDGYRGADFTLAALDAWATPARRAHSDLLDSRYDAAGRLAQTLAYADLDAAGAGIENDAAELVHYLYDAQGLLRQRIVLRSSTAAPGDGRDSAQIVSYGYDGIGRLLSETLSERTGSEAARVLRSTTWLHQDNGHTLRTTLEGGAVGDGDPGNDLLVSETRNAAGQLIATTRAAASGGPARGERHYYDDTGRLRASENAGGARRYYFYDGEGALAGEVDELGTLREHQRDPLGRIVRSTVYATRLDTSAWLADGRVQALDLAAVRPAADAADRSSESRFDALGRLREQRDGEGTQTRYLYDGSDRLIETRVRAAAGDLPDRATRYFYDAAGRESGRLDAEGFLVETRYDRAGRISAVIAYAGATAVAERAAGDLERLRPPPQPGDQLTRHFYDGRGNRIGTLDADGVLSETVFDEARNQRAQRVYATRLSGLSGEETFAQLRGAAQAGGVRETRRQFDASGRLSSELDPEGSLTRYVYDPQGRLLHSERAAGTSEVREDHRRYDAFGNLTGELSGEGAARLRAGMSEAELDALYAQYGVRHRYDALDRRIESVDAEGNLSWYFYDAAGRPTFSVRGVADAAGVRNGAGEVSEIRYNSFGEVEETIAYTDRIVVADANDRASVAEAVRTLRFVAERDSRERYAYDRRGQVLTQTDAEDAITRNVYNGFGELAAQRRELAADHARETRYDYDRRGQWLSRTEQSVGAAADGSGRRVERSYDAFGRLVASTDARGHVVRMDYDRVGRQIGQQQTVGGRLEATATTYDAFGRVFVQTDASGRTTRYAYDDAARTLSITTPEGIVATTTRNRFGQSVRVSDGLGHASVFDYDRDGRLVRSTDAEGGVSTQVYDRRGLTIRSTDAAGTVTRFVYDARGRTIERTQDPDGLALTQRTQFDGQGRSIVSTDAAGVHTTLRYDRKGQLLEQVLDADGLALRTTYAWNADGRQLRVTTGAGSAQARTVEYGYDALGRRVRETVAPGVLDLSTLYAYDGNDQLVARTDAAGRTSRYVYDAAGRATFAIDGAGGVVEYAYDLNGRRVATRAYAQAIDLSGLPLAADGAQVQARLRADDARDVVHYLVYDRDGRERLSLDGAGAVVATDYDGAGRSTAVTRYANAVVLDAGLRAQLRAGAVEPAAILAALAADPARDQASFVVRDALGRERLSIDAAGAVVETGYDRVGRPTGLRRYAAAWPLDDARRAQLRVGALSVEAIAAGLPADPARDPASVLVYDAVGRLRYTLTRIDAASAAVAETRYDAVGRATARIDYGVVVAFDPAATETGVGAALAAALGADPGSRAAQQRSTSTVYDAAGRARFVLDPGGGVSEMRYDASGLVTHELRYLHPRASAPATLAELQAWAQAQAAGDRRVTRSEYDAAGRVRSRIDALDQRDLSEYDGSGQLIAYTNRDGHRWSYEYDGAGRRRAEIGPPVAVAGADAAGHVGVVVRAVVVRIGYDGQGNVVSRSEDADSAQARTTLYDYDQRGHQVRTRFADAGVVDHASGELVATGTGASVEVVYDVLGRAVVQRDVRGHYSYKSYDVAGRLAAEADADGYVTAYAYDALGQQTGLVRHARAIDPGLRDAGQALSREQLLGSVAASDDDRRLSTDYDLRGHKTQVRQGAVATLDAAGNPVALAPLKRFAYDAYGDLVRESEQVDATRWADTHRYYDALGRLSHSVDAEGYLTVQRYNAMGEVLERTEYARALDPAAVGGTRLPAPPPAGDAAIGFDRNLRWQYDALGRKIAEIATRHSHDHNGVPGVREAVTAIGYDGEGHALSVTVDGQTTLTAYDALGRSVSVRESEREALRADAGERLRDFAFDLNAAGLYERVSPYSSMLYDGFGNLVQLRRYAHGVRAGEAAPQAAADDNVHTMRYDRQGRAVWERDAAGTVHTKRYDAADHLLETRSRLDGNEGRSAVVVIAAAYDRSGRQTVALTTRELYLHDQHLGSERDAASQVRYNAFGEIVAKDDRTDAALATQDFAAHYVYDAAGRMVRSNSEGGVWRDYVYNLAGHAVRSVQPMRSGPDAPLSQAVTDTEVDRLGRTVRQQLAAHGDRADERAVVSQRVDRWGNVLEVVDPRGGSTQYEYNELGQKVREVRPWVRVVHANGGEAMERPELAWYYDALGREIGSRDANGNQRRQFYDGAGRLLVSQNALGYETRLAYDAAGRQSLTQDPNGYLSFREFDRSDRIVAQGDYLPSADGSARERRVRERYLLNQGGHRLQVADALGHTASYDYDSRGQVVRSRTAAGVAMRYAYDAQGRKIRETNALSDPSLIGQGDARRGFIDQEGEHVFLDEQTWDYDYFGRATDHNDLSGNDYGYEYDPITGQLLRQTVGRPRPTLSALLNPGFDQGLTGWEVMPFEGGNGGAQLLAGAGPGGGNAIGLSGTGEPSDVHVRNRSAGPVVPGQSIKVSMMAALPGGTWGTSYALVMSWYDAAGNEIARHAQPDQSRGIVGNGWRRTEFTFVVPEGAVSARAGFYFNASNSSTQSTGLMTGFEWGVADAGPAIDPDNGQREYRYYPNGRIKEILEPTGRGVNITRYVYDASGNRTVEETFTYDADGKPLHLRTRSEYDSHNRLVRVTQDDVGQSWQSGDPPPNAGFEDGDVGWEREPGWEIVPESGDQGDAHTGGWSARYNGNGPARSIISKLRARVQPGQTVDASAMIQQGASSSGDAGARVLIIWYDAHGAMLPGGEGRSWSGGNVVDSGSGGRWHPSRVVATVPAGAAYMAIAVNARKSTNKPMWVDDLRWSYQPVPDDPGQTPTNRRLMEATYAYDANGNRRRVEAGSAYNPSGAPPANASLEDGDAQWELGDGWSVRDDADGGDANSGTFSARFDGREPASITSKQRVPVQPGQVVNASVMVQQGASSSGDAGARVLIVWYDANGVMLPGGEGRSWVGGNVVDSGSNGNWHKSRAVATVPPGAAFMTIAANARKSTHHPLWVDDFAWSYQAPGASPGNDDAINLSENYWYDYDAENRVTVSNGKLIDGRIALADDGVSFALGYDRAGHAVQRRFIKNGAVLQETTEYDLRGQRVAVLKAAPVGASPQPVAETFSYDAAGRQTVHRTYDDSGFKQLTSRRYDADGRMVWQANFGRSADGSGYGEFAEGEGLSLLSKVGYSGTGGYDAAGRLIGYTYYSARHEAGVSTQGPAGFVHTYHYQYDAADSYLEQHISGTSSHGDFKASTSTSAYDAWGRRISVHEQTPNTKVSDRIRYFAYDGEGHILRRREGTLRDGTFHQDEAAVGQTQFYAYVNGQQVASGKYNGEIDIIGRLTAYDTSQTGSVRINVQAGDTLRSIAQRVYGNANLWYVLAQANAITDEQLVEGATLTVPEVKVTANDANTFRPYNPSEAIGNTAPSLPYIPPPPKNNCNGLAMVLMVAVAVVVTVFTAGAAAVAMSAAAQGIGMGTALSAAGMTGIMSAGGAVLTGGAIAAGTGAVVALGGSVAAATMAAAAAGGFAGSIASQVVGKSMGVVDHFSLRGAIAGGLTAGITAGIGSQLGPMSTLIKNREWGTVAASAAMTSAGGYVANRIAGVDTSFSWRGIAASAASAVIAGKINQTLGTVVNDPGISGDIINDTVGGMVGGVVSLHTRRAFGFGDSVNYGSIAADAFGNALANAAVSEIGMIGIRRRVKEAFEAMSPDTQLAAQGVGGYMSRATQSYEWDDYARLAERGETPTTELPSTGDPMGAEYRYHRERKKIDALSDAINSRYLDGYDYRGRGSRHNDLVNHLEVLLAAYKQVALGGGDKMLASSRQAAAANDDSNAVLIASQLRASDVRGMSGAKLRQAIADGLTSTLNSGLQFSAETRQAALGQNRVGTAFNFVRMTAGDAAGLGETGFLADLAVSSAQGRVTVPLAVVAGGLQSIALDNDGAMATKLAQIGLMSRGEASAIVASARSNQAEIPARIAAALTINIIGGGKPIADGVELAAESGDAMAARRAAGSRVQLRDASVLKRSLATMLGSDLSKAIAHDTGNVQFVYKTMRMNIPVGTSKADVAQALARYENDPVGKMLQDVTDEIAPHWNIGEMTEGSKRHYNYLVESAVKGNAPWIKAHLFESRMKGQWVENMVLDDARIRAFGVTGKSIGVDVTHNGLRYDIMSGTESNFARHATRQGMSDLIFRMIHFKSQGR